ncbi:MAG: hypothetical protein V4506_12720 [Bacteroidota bacterium]
MTSTETKQQTFTLPKNVLAGILMMQLGFAYHTQAQNTVIQQTSNLNFTLNNSNNISQSVNVFRNSNNGPAQMTLTNNVQNTNNRPRPNTVVAHAQNQSVRPAHNPRPVSVARPVVHTNRTSNHRVSRVIQQNMPVQENNTVEQTAVVQADNVSVNPQLLNNAPDISNDNNVSANNIQAFVGLGNLNTNVSPMNLNNAPVVASSRESSSRRSVNSVSSSSSKSSHSSSKSKRSSLKHFRYTTGKKFQKFFAKNKKNKFDPTKCFVWK